MSENLTATVLQNNLTAEIGGGLQSSVMGESLTATIVQSSLSSNVEEVNLIAQVTSGMQGEPGSAAEAISGIAGEALSALKVVRAKAGGLFICNSSDLADADMVIGITLTSASSGGSVNIQAFGSIEDSFWNWTLDKPIYFTSTGTLTQTPPVTGFCQQVATPATATRININIKQAIKLI